MDLDTLILAADSTGVNTAIRGGLVWIMLPALGIVAVLAVAAGSGKWVSRAVGGAALGLAFVFATAADWTAIGNWLGGVASGIPTLSP